MKIYLREISDQERIYNFTAKEGWLLSATEKADEVPFYKEWPEKNPRFIELTLISLKTDGIYWIKGNIKTEIGLICSRCGDPFVFKCNPPFQHLYSQDESLTGGGDAHSKGKESYQKSNSPDSMDELDQHSDQEVTFLEEEFIPIDPIVTEHLLISTPFQPKCDVHGSEKKRCIPPLLPEGVELPVKETPFSVLKSLKVNKNH